MTRITIGRLFVVLLSVAALMAALPVQANWLTKLGREAGEASGRAGRHAAGNLDHAAAHVATLPKTGGKSLALAAHATPEGHWTFANGAGERITAGTPAEMKRAASLLAPDVPPGTPLSLYLSEDTIFLRRTELAQLPKDAALHVVSGREAYALRRVGAGDGRLVAEVRPGVVAELTGPVQFKETVWQLARPLNRSDVRVLSLTPGAADTLPRVPRFDAATRSALVDQIEPSSLMRALASLKGQTALITGRATDGRLYFQPASGAEQYLVLADLKAAAAASDVNLVMLQSAAPRQPGGRNWLWQKVAVEGLDDALKRATFGDFLASLSGGRGTLAVGTRDAGTGRVILRAEPLDTPSVPLGGKLGDWLAEVTSSLTGNVVTAAIEADQRSSERQKEFDARIVPGIPAAVQLWYLAGIVTGLMGLGFARAWWQRLWPRERLQDYAGRVGYVMARAVRGLAFVLVFLPFAGPFALLAQLGATVWGWLTAPMRLWRWLRRRPAAVQ